MGIKIPGVNVSLHSMIWESIYLEDSLVNLKNLQDLFAAYIYIYIYIYGHIYICVFEPVDSIQHGQYSKYWYIFPIFSVQQHRDKPSIPQSYY